MTYLNSLCLFTALCFGDHILDKKHHHMHLCDIYRSEDGLSIDINHENNHENYQQCLPQDSKFHSILLRNLRYIGDYNYLSSLISTREFQHLIIHKCDILSSKSLHTSLNQHISFPNHAKSLVIHSSKNIISWWNISVHFSHIHIEESFFGWNDHQSSDMQRWLEKYFVHENLISFSVIGCPGCINTLGFLVHATGLKVLRLENSFSLNVEEKSLRLSKLKIIYLRNNQIRFIPVSLFQHFPLLEELDIGGNNLLLLDSVYDFSKLRDFNIADNYHNCETTADTLCQFGGLTKTMFDSNNQCLKHPKTRVYFSKCPHFKLTSRHLVPENNIHKISHPKLVPFQFI
ncbi:uncharacterized protein LOC141856511 [Brevipalpus obovatus]|uniref:uncharacterized protein LOC141856511 n=1 Tax=Brevipalpus obovatus TaxID=246614 RepID=UPI003D9DD87F